MFTFQKRTTHGHTHVYASKKSPTWKQQCLCFKKERNMEPQLFMFQKTKTNGNIHVFVSIRFQISAQDKEAHPSMRQGTKRRRDHDHNHNREL